MHYKDISRSSAQPRRMDRQHGHNPTSSLWHWQSDAPSMPMSNAWPQRDATRWLMLYSSLAFFRSAYITRRIYTTQLKQQFVYLRSKLNSFNSPVTNTWTTFTLFSLIEAYQIFKAYGNVKKVFAFCLFVFGLNNPIINKNKNSKRVFCAVF